MNLREIIGNWDVGFSIRKILENGRALTDTEMIAVAAVLHE